MNRRSESIGQRIIVPSSLTGALLEYFVPYPLTEIAERYQIDAAESPPAADDLSSILPLIPLLVAGRSGQGDIDPVLLALHAQVISGTRPLTSVLELIALGNEINRNSNGLRRQIVYSGGPTPSSANIIFPPPSELPALVNSMATFLDSDLAGWNPGDLSVLVCEYAARVHPFNDGNGRWARLLALDAGRRSGSLWAGACAALLNQQRIQLESARKADAKTASMDGYLLAGSGLSSTLYTEMRVDGTLEEAAELWNLAREYTKSSISAVQLALISVTSRPTAAALSARFDWSAKKSQGYVARLSSHATKWGKSSDGQSQLVAHVHKTIGSSSSQRGDCEL